MSDEHLLRRIMILGNELSECQQEAIFHRDLAVKTYEKSYAFGTCLREGLEATKRADGHWSDRVRWMSWVDKVEKELAND